jgi:mRNA-degrading endonuclease toxin of MazEF toxin-antitoxin module
MPAVNPGEIWMTDFGMAAKVRPALLLTGQPAANELDLVTVLTRNPDQTQSAP